MTQKFDVASRLAEGRPAVENVQKYVWACHLLGYEHPDLTLHGAQVRDGYGTEDGLDLRTLDVDCAALEGAVAATQDAVTRQDDQLAAVSTAWQGRGAQAAWEFLRRHGQASAAAVAALRTAADALAVLRDDLWQAVDARVAAAVAIDDRTLPQRGAWLAAAQTVTTGVGDRAAASERIDQEVKPFVDNNVRADWLSAMRAATAAASDAYEKAIAELRAEPDAIFDVPGDLGPSWTPPPDDVKPPVAAAAPAFASAPPVWSPPSPASMTGRAAAAPAAPPPPPPVPVPPPVDAAPTAAPPMPAMPSAAGMGGGLPDIGGGLSGFGQQLADSLGGLLGSTGDALPDPLELDEPDPLADDDDERDEPEDDEERDTPEKEPTQPDEAQPAEETVAQTGEACAPPTAEPPPVAPPPAPVEPEPAPVAVPPPAGPAPPPEPPVPADPLTATGTPCEIAADELPQAGQ